MKTRNRLSLLLLLVVAAAPVRAGVNLWTPFGPGAAAISDFVLQPAGDGGPPTLYVLAMAPFVTHDDGESWTWSGSGLPETFYQGSPSALTADPAVPGTLYVANLAGQVFRSVDAGRNWSFLASLEDGSEELYLYLNDLIAAGGALYASTTRGLFFRSLDGGQTWSHTEVASYISTIVPDPTDPETVYVAGDGGVLKSTDCGETWSPLLEVEFTSFTTLAISADGSTLYAGEWGESVYASTDRGATWKQAVVGQQVAGLAIDPGSPSRVYVSSGSGFFVSADGGATWQTTTLGSRGPVAVDPSRPAMVYALSYDEGMSVSRDRGLTWSSPLQRGLGFPRTDLLERNPDQPSSFVLCRSVNLLPRCLRSQDDGRTWTLLLGNVNFPSPAVRDLAFEPRNPDYVYMVAGGIYLVRLSTRIPVRLALDEQRSAGLKTVVVSGRALIVGGDLGAYRSTDVGRTWKGVLPYVVDKATRTVRSVLNLVQDPENADIIYALAREFRLDGGNERRVLYQSLDGGARWRRLLEGARLLAVDPSRPRTLYAVRGSDLLRSRDRGATWKLQGTFPTASVQGLAVAFERPSVLLAATDGSGVLLSEDSGHTWTPFNAGLARPGLLRIGKLTADPKVPGRFFAMPFGSAFPPSGGLFEATVE